MSVIAVGGETQLSESRTEVNCTRHYQEDGQKLDAELLFSLAALNEIEKNISKQSKIACFVYMILLINM